MPPGRFHRADQRQLGGAFQDNRIIPNEGINAAQLTASQREQLLAIARTFLEILPAGPLAAKMTAIERQLPQTWFSWIGGYGDEDPFYYRIQNPVVMLEFDHHSGVFLTNTDADKCHIHNHHPHAKRQRLRQGPAETALPPGAPWFFTRWLWLRVLTFLPISAMYLSGKPPRISQNHS